MHDMRRGDVAFYANIMQLGCMPWQRAHKVDARFEGHEGELVQVGGVRVRARNEVCGSRSSVRADGGTVARMLELVSCFSGLPDHAPLSSYCCGK